MTTGSRLPGHALRSEGRAFVPSATSGGPRDVIAPDGTGYTRCRGHIGYGLCECGAISPSLHSAAARKRWHAEHKAKVRTPPPVSLADALKASLAAARAERNEMEASGR